MNFSSPIIPYKTKVNHFKAGQYEWELETIDDLDQAIDDICQLLNPEDPLSEDLSPYFGILWESSVSLTNYLDQIEYIPLQRQHLEIGAGLALPSFWIARNHGVITATDSHPDVEWFLKRNQSRMEIHFPFRSFNWRTDYWSSNLVDVVIGSDVLYESRHPEDIVKALMKILKPGGRLILSDPGRGYLQGFQNALEQNNFKGKIHIVDGLEKESFILDFVRTK